jgi:hypothetical protein
MSIFNFKMDKFTMETNKDIIKKICLTFKAISIYLFKKRNSLKNFT